MYAIAPAEGAGFAIAPAICPKLAVDIELFAVVIVFCIATLTTSLPPCVIVPANPPQLILPTNVFAAETLIGAEQTKNLAEELSKVPNIPPIS